jgi:hypothetical protein
MRVSYFVWWLLAFSCLVSDSASGKPLELVMCPGSQLKATTTTGTIRISAGAGLKRTYEWDGAARSVVLIPREKRWLGSLGAYYPGPGDHWKPHEGITRGVVEEGQQHFIFTSSAMRWLHLQKGYYPTVYRDDGLVVSYGKVLLRRQLNVEVWQIFIRGKKPTKLAGSNNLAIRWLRK